MSVDAIGEYARSSYTGHKPYSRLMREAVASKVAKGSKFDALSHDTGISEDAIMKWCVDRLPFERDEPSLADVEHVVEVRGERFMVTPMGPGRWRVETMEDADA